jgi:hypothetical protein
MIGILILIGLILAMNSPLVVAGYRSRNCVVGGKGDQ